MKILQSDRSKWLVILLRRIMKKLKIGYFLLFGSGFVCAINLTQLYPNPEYQASWGNVAFCCILAITGYINISPNGEN